MTLIELYAGMAAVSWGCFGAAPPVCYQGGKRGYQQRIRELLRVTQPSRIVLVEQNPFVADALRVAWCPALRAEACALIEEWSHDQDDQRARWERYRLEAHAGAWPTLPLAERGARWLWMRPRTVPFQTPPLVGRGNWLKAERVRRSTGRPTRDWRHCTPQDKLAALPSDLPPVEVITGNAEDVVPVRGSVVYMDPPYPGTTGYQGAQAPTWQAIVALAHRWAQAGATVGVSVQQPVGLECHQLRRVGARSRNLGGTPEFLTIFRPQTAISEPARGARSIKTKKEEA